MAAAKFLILAIVVAALLPAGREVLDDVVREFSNAKHQAVLKAGRPDRIGSAAHDRKPSERF